MGWSWRERRQLDAHVVLPVLRRRPHRPGPGSVARAIFDGVEIGEGDIFPGPTSRSIANDWRNGATKALERQFATLVGAVPAGA